MRRLTLGVVAGIVLAGGGWWAARRVTARGQALPIPGAEQRITVEVLNAAGIDGLARAVTRRLRHRGVDVVFFGTAPVDTFESTLILVRRGDSTAAVRVRDALGTGRVVVEHDARLLLDVSVMLGAETGAALHLRP